jgi:lysophospholipase L1-like esterase
MNTNPNAKRILCFGDSNTWGYIPGTKHNRYPADVRWAGVLQNLLGQEYEIIEEALNSRGIMKGDRRPGKEGRIAMEYILPCLDSHDPLDYVIVMLGSNELKAEFNLPAIDIGENLRHLVETIQNRNSQFRDTKPQIIIVVPPTMNEQTQYSLKENKYVGAHDKSVEMKKIFAQIAQETNCAIVDVQDELVTGEDGVHLLPESHEVLAKALFPLIK